MILVAKYNSSQSRSDLPLFRRRSARIVQRLIVAEEPFDQVEAGRQAARLVDIIKPVGKQLAKGVARSGDTGGLRMLGIDQDSAAVSEIVCRSAAGRAGNVDDAEFRVLADRG